MKIHCMFSVLVAALLPMGCAAQGSGLVVGTSTLQMVGSADVSSTDNVPTKRLVFLDRPMKTEGVMAIDVLKTDTTPIQRYRVIFGPSKDDPQSAKGFFFQEGHPTDSDRSIAGFHLIGNCWVYVYGQSPIIRTGRVSAGSDGSKILIQIDAAANVHRVYFRGGKSPNSTATVTALLNQPSLPLPPRRRTLAMDQFVEADYQGNLTQPTDIANAGVTIRNFLDYVDGQKKPFEE